MKARFLAVLASLLAVCAGHGQISLANFSTNNPIKIMPVGDSITDDCEVTDAWRRYFQAIADSNGVPFTFVGRQTSPVAGAFTKVHHEGYCGTVIAPPGVFAAHQYTTTNAYLEKIVPDALTNATPNIILIMIGANDIGRGRDPYTVATNDMPRLLDIIYSNLPNVFVILDKPTTLSNASIGTPIYGNFATNVPIYAAQLQEMVNQRRALGQNVFLADMFSAVDYATGFMSDHVHPNAIGLTAVAKEWFTRVQAILTGTNRITASLAHGGDLWTYSDSGVDLGTNWSQPGFDDGSWTSGYGRFGFGELIDETIINSNTTTYFRKTFVVPYNEVFTNLNFRMAQTGGAVIYLNGQEMYRTNLPNGPISYGTLATTNLIGYRPDIYYQTNIAGTNLLVGTNVLAVEVHQSGATNQVMGFDMELLGGAAVLPPPTINAALGQNNLVLTWPTNTGGTYAIYSATNVGQAAWQPVSGPLETNGSQVEISITPDAGPAFFRLQRNQ